MKETAILLNEMSAAGVIGGYALFGAVAQMRYTEPVATLDVEVLIVVPDEARLDILGPIFEFCRSRGYLPGGEGVQVGAWPVQFIPVFSPLTREALEQADIVDYEGVPLRVARAEYLAVIALSVGRAKDHARIPTLLESGGITREDIADLAALHGLDAARRRFKERFLEG